MLRETLTVRSSEDNLIIMPFRSEGGDAAVDGFNLQHHSGSEAESVVVHFAVFAECVVAEVVHEDLRQTFVFGSLDDGVVERRLKKFGAAGDDVYSHGMSIVNYQGTGSYPEPPHGLQRRMRFMPNQPPLKIPCFITASTMYWLHVGV